jgi:hypothetical protein
MSRPSGQAEQNQEELIMPSTNTAKVSTTPVSRPSDDEFDSLRDEIKRLSEHFDRNWPSLFARPWSATAGYTKFCQDRPGVNTPKVRTTSAWRPSDDEFDSLSDEMNRIVVLSAGLKVVTWTGQSVARRLSRARH